MEHERAFVRDGGRIRGLARSNAKQTKCQKERIAMARSLAAGLVSHEIKQRYGWNAEVSLRRKTPR
jgi:hypothetical protein